MQASVAWQTVQIIAGLSVTWLRLRSYTKSYLALFLSSSGTAVEESTLMFKKDKQNKNYSRVIISLRLLTRLVNNGVKS